MIGAKKLNFIRRFCYIVIPLISVIVLLVLFYCFPELNSVGGERLSIMPSIAGTLAGFLLAGIALLSEGPKATSVFIRRFYASNHFKIILRTIFFGIIWSLACVLTYVLIPMVILVMSLFVMTISNTVIATWYVYRIVEHKHGNE